MWGSGIGIPLSRRRMLVFTGRGIKEADVILEEGTLFLFHTIRWMRNDDEKKTITFVFGREPQATI